MTEIKKFSISFPLSFTNDDVKNSTDLGCVYLCDVYKTLGHGNGFEASIIVNKKTMLPVTLNEPQVLVDNVHNTTTVLSPEFLPSIEKEIILDKIAGSNKKIPQEKYFTLRFSKENRTSVYTPDGKLTIFDGYNPVEADYFCGKNIIAFSPAWSGKYLFFDPLTGKKIDIASMVPAGKGFKPKEANGDLEICVYKGERNSYDTEIAQRFVVSEDFRLLEVAGA